MKKTFVRFLVVAALSAVPFHSFAASQSQTPAAAQAGVPDPAKNPILAKMKAMGGDFFYMGTEHGMDGWFIVKNGQVQMMYSTPDNKGAIVGVLFGEDGTNLTMQQVRNIVQSDSRLSALIADAQKEHEAIAGVGDRSFSMSPTMKPDMVPSVAVSPGERLLSDLSSASGVVMGKDGRVEVEMFMDTRCPHCKATWKTLSKYVGEGKLRVRLIPAANAGSDNENEAAVLLGSDNPAGLWEKHVSGEKGVLSGTPKDSAIAAVKANTEIADKWSLSDLPYLVYRAQDGKVKVVKGAFTKEGLETMTKDLGF